MGFTIKNKGSSYSCVYLNSVSNCKISNNIIKNGGNGIYLVNSDFISINNNIAIEQNIISGVYLSNSNNNLIQGNKING